MKDRRYILLSRIVVVLVALIFSHVSCKKDSVLTPEKGFLGYEYFPVQVGNYIIYDVDSIVFNDFTGNVDTFQYQIKVVIESEFIDNENRVSQRIERYIKSNNSNQWIVKDIWSSSRTESRAELVEENVKFVKLIFPIKENYRWDGNAYNTMEEWKYEYKAVHQPDIINNLPFDSTLTIIQREEFNLIESQSYIEKYAINVGLIFKKIEDLKTEINGNIKSGIKYTQIINEYGKL